VLASFRIRCLSIVVFSFNISRFYSSRWVLSSRTGTIWDGKESSYSTATDRNCFK
jgi:hypothetical protein